MTTDTKTVTDDNPETLEALFNELSEARDAGKPVADTSIEKPEPLAAAPAPAAAEPTPAQPTPTQSSAEPTAVPAPAAPQPPAIDVTKLDEDTRRYVERLENDRRAAVGRAAAMQRELASAAKRQAAPTPAKVAEGESAIEKLNGEFPELGKAISEATQSLTHEFNAKLENATWAAKTAVLEGVFPGWLNTMKSPEFHFWLTQQDEATQRRFDSDSVGDYATLLRSFEKSQQPPAPTGPTEVERIRQEREARLNSAPQINQRATPPNPTGEPDPEADPEGYFNWLAARRDKARASGNVR